MICGEKNVTRATDYELNQYIVFGLNGSQLAKMKKSIPDMSLP